MMPPLITFRPSYVREDGGETQAFKRERLRRALIEYDPRCRACGRELVINDARENTARLAGDFLSCPAHTKIVRIWSRTGETSTTVNLARKGREYILAHRPADQLVSIWLVDGMPFTSEASAMDAAQRMSEELGSTLEVFAGYIPASQFKRVQVVKTSIVKRRKAVR